MQQWRRLLSRELSLRRRWRPATFAVVLVLGTLAFGVVKTQNGVFRNNFDVFGQFLSSPLTLVFPLVVALLTCVPLYQELGDRFIVNTRSRIDLRLYVGVKLVSAALIAFAVFFFYVFATFAVAFLVWPAIGNPNVDPAVYNMSAADAVADSLGSASYSSLLQFGPFAYGLTYALWVGILGAAYSAIGTAALLLLSNRSLALSVPFLIYLLETVISALLGAPVLGLLYSAFPYGLTQTSVIVAAAPSLVLIAATAIMWFRLFPRLHQLDRLA